MASLNTLRTKGGWFLTIVIVLALLAFIMGDAFSGQGRKNPVVGVINGEKVTYTDFLNERTRQQEMIQGAGEEAQEQAYAQAWSELVNQNALMPGFETLGLGLSEEEQKDMTSGVGGGYISPVIEQYFRNPETGAFDPAVLAYFIGNMTEREHAAWQMIKKQANDERLFSKYGNLVAAGLFINDLELNAAVEAENAAYDARVVFKPYSSIVDSTVTVPASELKAYYNSHKEKYRRGASREVEYVVFDILPSADDMEEGRKHVEELAAQFAAAADPAQFAALNSDDKTPATFVREDAVAVPLDGAPVLEGETYTMSRLAERRMLPDSVTFGAIILAQGREQLADSLMNVANGSNFPRLADEYSEDRQSELAAGKTVTVNPLDLTPQMSELLIGTPAGRVAKIENGGYILLVHVAAKTALVEKVKVATLKYTVRASAATHAEITSRARDFYTKVSSAPADFSKIANEMSLPRRVADIANTDREIRGLENSIPVVRWAFDNKKGAIMEPEELSRNYIVVSTLKGITEQGVAPFDEVSSMIRSLLVQRKKGEMLSETLAGTSLDQVAQQQGLEIIETTGLKYTAYGTPELGFDPRLVGAICTTRETGKLSKPVKGTAGVYAFEVTNILAEDNADAEGMKVRMQSMNEYMMTSALMNALYEKSNVVDERVRYF